MFLNNVSHTSVVSVEVISKFIKAFSLNHCQHEIQTVETTFFPITLYPSCKEMFILSAHHEFAEFGFLRFSTIRVKEVDVFFFKEKCHPMYSWFMRGIRISYQGTLFMWFYLWKLV